ncbi:MAG: cell division protein FtsL [Halioglobus sp.]|nr:cell division protein FtsL [Halioglobus sp.]
MSARGRKGTERPAQGAYRGRLALANLFALFLTVASAFAVIHSTYSCRELYAQLQVLESTQWYLQEDYSRLLIEQSTWASHHRVETVARDDLGMSAPALERFRVVAQ